MTDSARDDLAFMRAVAEDRGPLPSVLGAHLFSVGLLYGLNLIYGWAGYSGLVPWPKDGMVWLYIPASVVYVPICIWLNIRGTRISWGPGARAFAAAWSGVGVVTITVVAIMFLATLRTGIPYHETWPAIALALYGGAWCMFAIVRGRLWAFLVSLGCCASAVACAALIHNNELWLAMGVGLLLFVGLPGFAMMRARQPAQELS